MVFKTAEKLQAGGSQGCETRRFNSEKEIIGNPQGSNESMIMRVEDRWQALGRGGL